ncbi:ricin-type beta-trefoil lectin domain protein [Micromonospora sp. M12]
MDPRQWCCSTGAAARPPCRPPRPRSGWAARRVTRCATCGRTPLAVPGRRSARPCRRTGGHVRRLRRRHPPPSGGTSVLRGVGSNRCLDVPNGNETNGTLPIIWDCHASTNQQWTRTGAGELRTAGGKCLDVYDNGTANGTVVEIWDCNGQANQQWRLNSDGSLLAVGADRCLDVIGNATANGSAVAIWDCNGGNNQKWRTT